MVSTERPAPIYTWEVACFAIYLYARCPIKSEIIQIHQHPLPRQLRPGLSSTRTMMCNEHGSRLSVAHSHKLEALQRDSMQLAAARCQGEGGL